MIKSLQFATQVHSDYLKQDWVRIQDWTLSVQLQSQVTITVGASGFSRASSLSSNDNTDMSWYEPEG